MFGRACHLSCVKRETAECCVPGQRPSGVARQQVDLAGLQGREALGGGERRVADRIGIAEERCGHGTADVDIEARPVAGIIRVGEAGKTGADAALDEALFENRISRCPRLGASPTQKDEHKRARPQSCSYHHSRPSSLSALTKCVGSIEYIQVEAYRQITKANFGKGSWSLRQLGGLIEVRVAGAQKNLQTLSKT